MIDAATFIARRTQFRIQRDGMPLVLTAYDELQLSADMAAPFRQQSAFLWMTGITQPGWRYMEVSDTEYLIRPNVSETQALFDGSLSTDDASRCSGISNVIGWKEARMLLKEAARTHQKVHSLGADPYETYHSFTPNSAQASLNKQLLRIFTEIEDCWPVMKKLIAIKDRAALAATEQAIEVTMRAFTNVKQALSANEYHYEYEIDADVFHTFRSAGTEGEAYDSIVASAGNACTLHYATNNMPLPDNGLVLIDAGALIDGYAADITRTYAVGTPTQRQRAVHAAVETAHRAIIASLKPGVSFESYEKKVDEEMKGALAGLGLLGKPSDYRTYFPHAISHGLGLDVHESLGGHKEFVPGMVLTVEPGIYIPEEGIGVRIEDNILITETGHINLSGALPTSL